MTGSRDGKAVLWWKNTGKEKSSVLGQYESAGEPLEIKGESITAIAFAPIFIDNCYLICLGLETGHMLFYKWSLEKNWQKCIHLDQR